MNGETGQAVAHFETLAGLYPHEPAYRWSLGMALLAHGDYERGFWEIDARWHPSLNGNEHDRALSDLGVPKWQGEPLGGKRIVLFHEWGLGDSIMMLRYLRQVAALAYSTMVVLPASLHPLVKTFPVGLRDDVAHGDYDFRCPLYDLPKYFGVAPSPYLWSPKKIDRRMRGHKIGIAWSGRETHTRDAVRSIGLTKFLQMLRVPGTPQTRLHALQTTDLDAASDWGVEVHDLRDFGDTAALISRMDAVVCVDTASAHLAGALGHPNAHVVLDFAHDWRWYRGSEWYPSLKLHRQKSLGDWASAFEEIRL